MRKSNCVCTACRLQYERSRSDWGEALPRCRHSGGSGSGGVGSLRHPAAAPAKRWRHRGRRRAPAGRSSRPGAAASGGSPLELPGRCRSPHARPLREKREEEGVRVWESKTQQRLVISYWISRLIDNMFRGRMIYPMVALLKSTIQALLRYLNQTFPDYWSFNSL